MNIWGADFPPTFYAHHIARRPREQRAALLLRVPEHLRDMVRSLVNHELWILTNWQVRLRARPDAHVPKCIARLFASHGLDEQGRRPAP